MNVVVIGAPRSGTNMLRDALARLPGAATWPCDEINYIWRHGNVRYGSDEFRERMARPGVQRYIQRQFDWVARRYDASMVVEKTCANSLRVPFVDRVLPEARYVFIRRDGVDAVGSAIKRWKAPLDLPYIARKTRFVPPVDLPYYAARYFGHRLHRLFSRERRLAVWGPQLDDMDTLLARHPLDEVCALQWQRCVESARRAFESMPSDCWVEVAYEDFVRQPEAELDRVLDSLGVDVAPETRSEAVIDVRAESIGKGRAALDQRAIDRIEARVQDTLVRYGYA
jgi:hypothetical protein